MVRSPLYVRSGVPAGTPAAAAVGLVHVPDGGVRVGVDVGVRVGVIGVSVVDVTAGGCGERPGCAATATPAATARTHAATATAAGRTVRVRRAGGSAGSDGRASRGTVGTSPASPGGRSTRLNIAWTASSSSRSAFTG